MNVDVRFGREAAENRSLILHGMGSDKEDAITRVRHGVVFRIFRDATGGAEMHCSQREAPEESIPRFASQAGVLD